MATSSNSKRLYDVVIGLSMQGPRQGYAGTEGKGYRQLDTRKSVYAAKGVESLSFVKGMGYIVLGGTILILGSY